MSTASAKVRRLKAVEEAPQLDADKYQTLFEQASDAILTVKMDGVIDAANEAVENLTGYLKTELVGSSIDLLVPAPKLHDLPQRIRAISRDMLLTPGTYEDVVVLRKDGYTQFVDFTVRKVAQGKSFFILAMFRDVTEKKRMERELITKHTEMLEAYRQLERKNAELQAMQETLVQSGKLAALGELAAGIAHELNQPLTGIRGYAQELQELALPALKGSNVENESTACLREIVSNVDKMAAIIGYLRSFVRKSTESYEFTQVHHAIEEALKMLSRQFASRGIRVERDFDSNLPEVFANPLQLEQVFINLATNARDAIEATGRGSGTIWISTRVNGEMIEVSFRDDGAGMSEKTKSKVFNPFFTTKEVGKGMGLGMSLSYGILSKLQASIVVESELGKGAAFLIRIPKDFRDLA
ncbi:MAG: sensor histidine kinase [Bdellovibrionia bacterium]